MDDNKTKNLNDSNDESNVSELAKKAKEQLLQFGSTQSEDINKNLGKFTNQHTVQTNESNQTIKLEIDKNVVEKATNEKLDFERFSKTQRGNKQTKTKFGEKFSFLLRNKKSLFFVWLIELISMSIFITLGILLVVKLWPVSKYNTEGPIKAKNLFSLMNAGVIFCWLSIFPCIIPLIYLLTSWFVGINQVVSSKIFHYLFIICLLFELFCLILGFALNLLPLIEIWSWNGVF